MMTILTVYFAISLTFSLGFVAGAWWASRARIQEGASMEVETIDRNHDQGAVPIRGRPSIAFGKGV
jgi:hypothetical protein